MPEMPGYILATLKNTLATLENSLAKLESMLATMANTLEKLENSWAMMEKEENKAEMQESSSGMQASSQEMWASTRAKLERYLAGRACKPEKLARMPEKREGNWAISGCTPLMPKTERKQKNSQEKLSVDTCKMAVAAKTFGGTKRLLIRNCGQDKNSRQYEGYNAATWLLNSVTGLAQIGASHLACSPNTASQGDAVVKGCAKTPTIVKEIAKLVMTPPSDSNTPTCDQLPTSPRRVHLPSPLSITVSSEYSCSITMTEPAHQFSSIPNHSWPNCYPSPPTEDQSNEQQIISEILLNNPTSNIGAMNDLTIDTAEPQLLSPGAADTAAFLYLQIGKPTSTKCERFMEFMRIQRRRRIRPRTMLEARAGALVGRPRGAGYGIGTGAGVPLPYLPSPARQRAELV
ncbi:hypothetical protein BC830DRAFT_1215787 [Chytriomyces sp. MP71]|nr:hypothetical protein BC830DRAFT_1215787 [Chytriomyces sp. MP71]